MPNGKITLTGMSPSIEGLSWQTEQLLRIGRQPQMDIMVNDVTLSRQHAEIRLSPQGWLVQDLGSAAGTYLNGVLTGKTSRKLQADDVLQCGKLVFKVSQLACQSPALGGAQSRDIKTSGAFVRVQANSQLTWEQGLRRMAQGDSHLPQGKQFLTLLRAGYHFSHIDSLSELLQTLLDDTVAVLDAQRGAIALVDETTAKFALQTQSGPMSGHGGRAFSQTLAQRCFSKGESVLCLDIGQLGELNASEKLVHEDMASIMCVLLRSPRRRLGILHLDRGPSQQPFSQEDFKLAEAIAATVSVGIESAMGVEKQHAQFREEVLQLTHQAMANRDVPTAQHCQRVCALALLLADALGLSAAEKTQVRLGSLLHDLGKIGLSDGLFHSGSDAAPSEPMRSHPLLGVGIAEKVSAFAPALPIIRSHHESWDGTGYPDGLQGEEIPRLARLVAVANALDHRLFDGSQRSALALADAIADIQAEAGRRFDLAIVAVLPGLRLQVKEESGIATYCM
jgi:putative nucleotidyltransferase with HDIG domain